MATRRTKSRREIYAQRDRINFLADELATRSDAKGNKSRLRQIWNRQDRAIHTADKYAYNIVRSKSYQDSINRSYRALKEDGFKNDRSHDIQDKAQDRKYSQATYVGNIKG